MGGDGDDETYMAEENEEESRGCVSANAGAAYMLRDSIGTTFGALLRAATSACGAGAQLQLRAEDAADPLLGEERRHVVDGVRVAH